MSGRNQSSYHKMFPLPEPMNNEEFDQRFTTWEKDCPQAKPYIE